MRFLLLLGILVATLALFNPNEEDFEVFARERMTDTISDYGRAAGGSLFGDVAGALGGSLLGALAGRTVQRDNYLVASVYTVDLDGPDADAQEWRFLGVAKQFIPLHEPEALGG